MSKYPWIRRVYLYLFTLIGLVLITIGCVRLVSLALKTYVFKQADIYYNYPIAKPVPAALEGEVATRSASSGQVSTEPTKEEIAEFEEKQRKSNRQREAAESIAMIIVGVPLYFYHWRVIRLDKQEEQDV